MAQGLVQVQAARRGDIPVGPDQERLGGGPGGLRGPDGLGGLGVRIMITGMQALIRDQPPLP